MSSSRAARATRLAPRPYGQLTPSRQVGVAVQPDKLVPTRLRESFSELPHCRIIWHSFRVSKEVPEAYPVVDLSLQLGVAEAVSCLENQQFHHQYGVHVRASSSRGLIVVHGLDYWFELVPVDLFFYFG